MRHRHLTPWSTSPRCRRAARGLTLTEALLAPACLLLLAALAVPVLGGASTMSDVEVSLNNLVAMGAAHATYAADWNGRQVSVIDDEISTYGPNHFVAFVEYIEETGHPHPALYLGWAWDESETYFYDWRYFMDEGYSGNYGLLEPVVFTGFPTYYGSFRLLNTRPFHQYLSGRMYDPVFYAPGDRAPSEAVRTAFDEPYEFSFDVDVTTDLGDIPAWSSYCLSPAALFDPAVMRHPLDGGWQDPWSLPDGFRTPSLTAATYPSLKTQIIEHNWVQNAPPIPCNPAFEPGTYGGCEPWYFNHGVASAPAALFYDMSVRLLPNTEALAADEIVMDQTGYGLWSRDTPWGEDGYLSPYAYDDIQLSDHILTTDGILGRDTIPGAASAGRARHRPSHDPDARAAMDGGRRSTRARSDAIRAIQRGLRSLHWSPGEP